MRPSPTLSPEMDSTNGSVGSLNLPPSNLPPSASSDLDGVEEKGLATTPELIEDIYGHTMAHGHELARHGTSSVTIRSPTMKRTETNKHFKRVVKRLGVTNQMHNALKKERERKRLERIENAKSPVQRFFIRVEQNVYFEAIAMGLIIVNCILLAMDNPIEPHDDPELWNSLELFFSIMFTIELVVRFVAHGPIGFITNAWTVMDLIIVVISWVSLGLEAQSDFTALRAFRALRPLRTIEHLPSLRIMLGSIIHSIRGLGNISILISFMFVIYGIAAMQLFGSALQHRCFFETNDTMNEWRGALCRMDGIGEYACVKGQYCRDSKISGPPTVGFANILQAWLTILQCATLEGWADLMYQLFESYDYVITFLFFITLVIIIGWFMIELMTGIVFAAYCEHAEAIAAKSQLLMKEHKDSVFDHMKTGIGKMTKWVKGDKKGQKRLNNKVYPMVAEEGGEGHTHTHTQQKEVEEEELLPAGHWTPRFRDHLAWLSHHHIFTYTIDFVIFVNVAFMASEHYNQPAYWTDFLKTSNYVFTGIFTLEMLILVYSLGPVWYMHHKPRVFDGLIVVLCWIEIIVELSTNDPIGLNALTALRTFRLLRIFKLLKSFKGISNVVIIITKSVAAVWSVLVLSCLFLIIYALLGLHLFAGKVPVEAARTRFDSFGWSCINVFIIMGGENWNDLMAVSIENTSWPYAIYFVLVFSTGQFLMLNVFFSVVFTNFEELQNLEALKHERRKSLKAQSTRPSALITAQQFRQMRLSRDFVGASTAEEEDEAISLLSKDILTKDHNKRKNALKQVEHLTAELQYKKAKIRLQTALASKTHFERAQNHYYSLYMFSPRNKLRKFCAIVYHRYSEILIIIAILASSLSMAFDTPGLDRNSTTGLVVRIIDYVTTVIFIIEFLMKTISIGFCGHKGSYIRDPWNVLALLVVVTSILSWQFGTSVGWMKALRVGATLKPLRFVQEIRSVRVVALALFSSMHYVGNVLSVMLMFCTIMGILGMQLFMGLFHQCELADGSVLPLDQVRCVGEGMSWRNPVIANYDNVLASVLSVFEVSSMEMWPNVMLRAIDISELGMAPKEDNQLFYSWFYVINVIIGNFFFFSLISGAVVSSFIGSHHEIQGDALLTDDQRLWVEMNKLSFSVTKLPCHRPPAQAWRKYVFKLVSSKLFDHFIMACILLNTITLASYVYMGSHNYILDGANTVFFYIFAAEAILKITALDIQYFGQRWNQFDFTIVISGTVSLILNTMGQTTAVNLTLFRAFRTMRIVRLARKAKTLNRLIRAILSSIPAVSNVAFFSFLLFFMYAVIGMSFFGFRSHGDFLTSHNNFEDTLYAMMCLFRVATGESWNGIMHDCMYNPCLPGRECAYGWVAVPYFVSFVIVSQLVVVSLFIGIAMNEFEESKSNHEIEPQDIEQLYQLWTAALPHKPWWHHVVPGIILRRMYKDEPLLELSKMRLVLSQLTGPLEKGANKIAQHIVDMPIWKMDVADRVEGEVQKKGKIKWGARYSVTMLILTVSSLGDHVDFEDPTTQKLVSVIDSALKGHHHANTTKSVKSVRVIEKYWADKGSAMAKRSGNRVMSGSGTKTGRAKPQNREGSVAERGPLSRDLFGIANKAHRRHSIAKEVRALEQEAKGKEDRSEGGGGGGGDGGAMGAPTVLEGSLSAGAGAGAGAGGAGAGAGAGEGGEGGDTSNKTAGTRAGDSVSGIDKDATTLTLKGVGTTRPRDKRHSMLRTGIGQPPAVDSAGLPGSLADQSPRNIVGQLDELDDLDEDTNTTKLTRTSFANNTPNKKHREGGGRIKLASLQDEGVSSKLTSPSISPSPNSEPADGKKL